MLIGSCMEHIVRAEALEDTLHVRLVADTRYHRFGRDIRILVLHHQTDIMLRGLCLVDEHHRSRFELSHLTNHL